MLRRLYNASGDAINPATTENQLPGEYPCSVHLSRQLSVTALALSVSKGGRLLTVTGPAGFVIGSKLTVEDAANTENDVLTVKGINGAELTVDRAMDADHAAGVIIRRVNTQLNSAVGSAVTPMVYEFRPLAGVWRITSLHLLMSSAQEPTLDKFGGIAALANGVQVRQCNDTGRDYTFALPFRSNAAMELAGGIYTKEDKVGTLYWTHFGFDFRQLFDAYFLVSPTSALCAAVQDDLSGLGSIEIKLGLRRMS